MDFFRSRSEYGSGGGSEGIEEAVPSSMSVAIDSSGCLFGYSSGGTRGWKRGQVKWQTSWREQEQKTGKKIPETQE